MLSRYLHASKSSSEWRQLKIRWKLNITTSKPSYCSFWTQELALGLKLMLRAVSKESFEPGSPILQTLRAARMTEEIQQNSPASVGPIAWLAAVCSPAKSDDYKPLNGFSLDAAASQFPCLSLDSLQAWGSPKTLPAMLPPASMALPLVPDDEDTNGKDSSTLCFCIFCEGKKRIFQLHLHRLWRRHRRITLLRHVVSSSSCLWCVASKNFKQIHPS